MLMFVLTKRMQPPSRDYSNTLFIYICPVDIYTDLYQFS